MKALILIAMVFFAEISFAAEISEMKLKEFLAKWLEAQNTGSYSAYANMYSNTFTGIKRSGPRTKTLNVLEWLKDREQMFKEDFVVKAINPEFNSSGVTASIKFEQWWESARYKDKGYKIIDIRLEGETLKIVREEMISSTVLSNKITLAGGQSKAKTDVTKNIIKTTSIFTSLKDNGCKQLSKKISMRFDNRNLDRSECKAPMGWRLFTVVGGEYRWLELAYKGSLWSTEEEVITKGDNRFGAFQSVDFERVEWIISSSGELDGFIFPVWAQDTESRETIYRYFTLKISDQIPYFCGAAKTTNEAKSILDGNCTTTLTMKTVEYLRRELKMQQAPKEQ